MILIVTILQTRHGLNHSIYIILELYEFRNFRHMHQLVHFLHLKMI